MGKTDGVLDLIGWRLGTKPRPQLYVGPSKDFITDQFEPRLTTLLDEAPSLTDQVMRGKRNKLTRKIVAGVAVRLAWAGSATQLSSDQAGDIYVDELDRMGSDVKGEGDPLTLVRARGFTYRDRKIAVTSTPKKGTVDIQDDDPSGLKFWKEADQLESSIWQLWQSGTRHHWTWPCPHCNEFFIPRFSCLRWPDKSTPQQALYAAFLECPQCGGVIEEKHKADMNARGVAVAPGQRLLNGKVVGAARESRVFSLWVSGLASPFITFGERASAFLEATATAEPEKIQGVINTGFGELFAAGGGKAPELAEMLAKRTDSLYKKGEVPDEVLHLTLTVDVQSNRLVWVLRGWGPRATSWLIDYDMFWGDTKDELVWFDLAEFMTKPYRGMPIRFVLVDSGFRPGKPIELPINRVYDFCRNFQNLVRPTKGSSNPMRIPVTMSRLDVDGEVKGYGLELLRLDTDYFKTWVHERIRWPSDKPGAWNLPINADEGYCLGVVSEARLKKPSGKVEWIRKHRENHYFDCEAMQAAAGYMLGVQRIDKSEDKPQRPSAPVPPQRGAPVRRSMQSSFMG